MATAPLSCTLSCAACGAPLGIAAPIATTSTTRHSQLDGERPAGVGRSRYLRAWRRGRDANDPEVIADGRARTMTPAAWQRWGASTPSRKPRLAIVRDAEADLLGELGLAAGGAR